MHKNAKVTLPVVLSVAGFDPSGGAGVLADTRTIAAFNCFPAAAITSITFQNDERVFGCIHQDAETVQAQIRPILLERSVASVKTGMLPTREIVIVVANMIQEYKVPCLVVDPVMKSTSGYELADAAAIAALKELFPLARVVTPNIPEAEKLVGFPINDEVDMRRATELIREMGARAVLLKGGHLQGASEAIDLLDDGSEITRFRGKWIGGGGFHGTGCMFSAATAACLARGFKLEDSVRQAKNFVFEALRGTGRK